MSASAHGTAWDLTPADRLLVEAKRWGSRLRFAVMLLFFRARGRFPRTMAEVDEDALTGLSLTLGVPASDGRAALLPDSDDRTLKRQRAEIRALLGFREASVADAEALGAWLRDNAVARTRDPGELASEAEAQCRALRIEPPTPDRIARIVRAAVRAYEDRRHAVIHARLLPDVRARLDALLEPAGPEDTGGAEDGTVPQGRTDAPLIHLRAGPGRASVASLRDELAHHEAFHHGRSFPKEVEAYAGAATEVMLARGDEARRLFPRLLASRPGEAIAALAEPVPDGPQHDEMDRARRSRPSWVRRLRQMVQGGRREGD